MPTGCGVCWRLVGALLLLMAGACAGASDATRHERTASVSLTPEAAAFLGPLATGQPFDAWHVVQFPHTQPGCLTLEVERQPGERFVIDVRARSSEAPPGVAETAHLAIYVRSSPGAHTPDAALLASTALAAALRAREESGHTPPPLESLPPAPK
jgi:hypothetical protein